MVAHNFKDLTGQKFGKLTVIERTTNGKSGEARWICSCECGKTTISTGKNLVRGQSKSCGCRKTEVGVAKRNDLVGKKFGRLLVTELAYIKNNNTYWRCLCDCGNETIVVSYSLTSGHTISCGCRQKEAREALHLQSTKHGKRFTRIYHTWRDMKERCLNPNKTGFKNYGGRGITICDDWKNDFNSFYEWAINNGYRDNLTIERIDVNGNYCPENCTWATKLEQNNNRRNTIRLFYQGQTHTLREWSKITGIPLSTIRSRSKRGLSVGDILRTPCNKNPNVL